MCPQRDRKKPKGKGTFINRFWAKAFSCKNNDGPSQPDKKHGLGKFHLCKFFTGYGGLPPAEPPLNPRRGSATGSYGLPVPPEWLRAQAENRRSSRAPIIPSSSLVGISGRDSPTMLEKRLKPPSKQRSLLPLHLPSSNGVHPNQVPFFAERLRCNRATFA